MEGGIVSPNCTPPLALVPWRQGGRDRVRETETDDREDREERVIKKS